MNLAYDNYDNKEGPIHIAFRPYFAGICQAYQVYTDVKYSKRSPKETLFAL